MTIRYQCDECGSVLNIKDEKAGTTGRCPKCKAEFLVPSPDAGDPRDEEKLADEAPEAPAESPAESPAGKPAVIEALAAKPQAADGNLSDDDIEKLLEGGEPKSKPAASAPHDDYLVADGVDQPYDDDDDDDDSLYESPSGGDSRFGLPAQGEPHSPAEAERAAASAPAKAPKKKPRRAREPEEAAPPAFSASGIAEGLMARGDNLVKHDIGERKGGRPFGGVDKGVTEEERFGAGEIIGYIGRYAIPVILGLALSGGFYYWWYSGWIRGNLPPLVPVTGTVTFDGTPLAQAEVHFHPMQADPKKPTYQHASSVGFTDANGNFSLIYVNNVAGAIVGKHRVQVFASDEQGRQKIPVQYNSRSTLMVEVKAEPKEPIKIDLSSKAQDTGGGKGGFSPPPR